MSMHCCTGSANRGPDSMPRRGALIAFAAMSSLAMVRGFCRAPAARSIMGMRASQGESRIPSNWGMLSRAGRRHGASVHRFSTVGGQGFRANDARTLNWDKQGGDKDVFISSLSTNGHVNVKVVNAKQLIQGVIDRQGISDVSAEVMGRVMLATMLVAHGIKDEETLQLTFNGNGLAGGVMAISDGACNVRGYIKNTQLDDLKTDRAGHPDFKKAIGNGHLQVVKAHPSWRVPYNGIVELVSSEVAMDVAYYLASSEQRNTAIGVGVIVEAEKVLAAGGFYIEMMPGAEEDSIEQIEKNLQALKDKFGTLDPCRLFFGEGSLSAYRLVDALLDDMGVGMAEETMPAYKCGCSKEKVVRAIGLMGQEEIKDMVQKQEEVAATCEFCGEEYKLTKEEVMELVNA